MFLGIFIKEFVRVLKSPAFWIFFAIFFALVFSYSLITDPYTAVMGMMQGKEWHNAPVKIAQMMTRLSVLGLLGTMILVGRSVVRDFETGIHELIFSSPITRFQYLFGRFFGSFSANLLIFMAIPLGFELSRLWMPSNLYGDLSVLAYVQPFLWMVLPNMLFIAAMMFALATLSRKMIATYLTGVAFLSVYASLGYMFGRIDSYNLRVLLDPFGINALNVMTRYWTVADFNANPMPVNIWFVVNRMLVLSLSIGLLIYTLYSFRFVAFLEKNEAYSKKKIIQETCETDTILAPKVRFNNSMKHVFSKSLHISLYELKRLVFHPAFILLTAMAISQIITNFLGSLGNHSGTRYPFTSWYLDQTVHLWMYMLPITIFFGGMLVWREKDNKFDEIVYTLPVPNWFSYLNKLLTLAGIQLIYLFLAMLSGIIIQVVFLGFYKIELGLYISRLFGIDFLNYLHLAIVVLFIQNLSPNKYAGFLLSSLYAILDVLVFEVIGFENVMLRYGHIPGYIYSNMNGYGHYAALIIWYSVYWLLFAAILAWITILMWRRTTENKIWLRFTYMLRHISSEQKKGLAVLTILFLISGSFIGYNRYCLNPYISEDEANQMQLAYETKYSKFANVPQPVITDIDLKADIFPEQRFVQINGCYILNNIHNQPIDTVLVNLNDWNLKNSKDIVFDRGFDKKLHAPEYGFRIFKLQEPLQPGDSMKMFFEYDIAAEGFTDNLPKNEIVENGSCLMLSSFSSACFPLIGYNVNVEMIRDSERVKYGLKPKPDAPPVQMARRSRAIMEVSRPNYEAVLSTSNDQIAITSGKLLDAWKENGRNYFHYKSDTIIENEIPVLSGRYAMQRENYQGVNVEVYYHPDHAYNIERIMDGLKDSHTYGSKYFSPYPYTDLRIVEVPDYMQEGAARHFPTTFIWKESEGFTTRLDSTDIDMLYAVAAHENTHHWWAGIVTPAYAEGAMMLTESITQYVMAVLLEKKYGKENTRNYLKSELKSYLVHRKNDREGERPLAYSSVQQSYIGYKKSSVVMYALQEYLGEDSVGSALGRIVDQYGFGMDYFPLSTDLLTEFYKVCPDSLTYLVKDMFEKVTLYENKAISARMQQDSSGLFLTELELQTIKYYADSVGNQQKAPMNDYIYVALFDENDDEIYYEKQLFRQDTSKLIIKTKQRPAKAGIDPWLLLIDRGMDDNVVPVKDKGKQQLVQSARKVLKKAGI